MFLSYKPTLSHLSLGLFDCKTSGNYTASQRPVFRPPGAETGTYLGTTKIVLNQKFWNEILEPLLKSDDSSFIIFFVGLKLRIAGLQHL